MFLIWFCSTALNIVSFLISYQKIASFMTFSVNSSQLSHHQEALTLFFRRSRECEVSWLTRPHLQNRIAFSESPIAKDMSIWTIVQAMGYGLPNAQNNLLQNSERTDDDQIFVVLMTKVEKKWKVTYFIESLNGSTDLSSFSSIMRWTVYVYFQRILYEWFKYTLALY